MQAAVLVRLCCLGLPRCLSKTPNAPPPCLDVKAHSLDAALQHPLAQPVHLWCCEGIVQPPRKGSRGQVLVSLGWSCCHAANRPMACCCAACSAGRGNTLQRGGQLAAARGGVCSHLCWRRLQCRRRCTLVCGPSTCCLSSWLPSLRCCSCCLGAAAGAGPTGAVAVF